MIAGTIHSMHKADHLDFIILPSDVEYSHKMDIMAQCVEPIKDSQPDT